MQNRIRYIRYLGATPRFHPLFIRSECVRIRYAPSKHCAHAKAARESVSARAIFEADQRFKSQPHANPARERPCPAGFRRQPSGTRYKYHTCYTKSMFHALRDPISAPASAGEGDRRRRWRGRTPHKHIKTRQLNIGTICGSPFSIARRYAGRSPMRFRYARIFAYFEISRGTNARIVVSGKSVMISAAVNSWPAR